LTRNQPQQLAPLRHNVLLNVVELPISPTDYGPAVASVTKAHNANQTCLEDYIPDKQPGISTLCSLVQALPSWPLLLDGRRRWDAPTGGDQGAGHDAGAGWCTLPPLHPLPS
jgi:hypothetical protein